MLKAMRRNVKKLTPTLWIVIAAFIIAIFAVWGGGGRIGETRGEKPLAVVGQKKISSDEYLLALRRQLEAMQSEFKGLNRELIEQLGIPQRVLQELIQQALLSEVAEELGLAVSEEEVRNRIMSLPVFQREGKFIGFEEYRRLLEWNRLSVSEFEANLKKDLLLNKVIQLLTANIVVREEEVWENYKKNNETARLEYLVLDKNEVEFQATPTAQDLQDYFSKNQARYTIPERRRGVMVFLSINELKKEIKITDADIEKYYQQNQEQFKEPEKIKVSRIFLPFSAETKDAVLSQAKSLLSRLKAGEDFAALAKQFSKDDKASQGGDWGEWEWRQLSPKEQEEIQKLAKGQDSLVEIEGGASLLRVTDKQPARTRPLTEVRTQIKTNLEDQKARELGTTKLNQLEKRAKKEKNLEVAAKKLGYKSEAFGPVKKGEGIPDKDPSGFISQTLFNLKEKEISGTIPTYDGIALCQLQAIEASHPASFEEVKSEVEKDWLETQKKEMAKEKLLTLKPKLMASQNWEEIARQNKLEYKTVNEHKREQYLGVIGDSHAIDQLLFSLPLSTVSEPVEYEGGYALFRVLERKEANREEFLKNRASEMDNLITERRNMLLTGYLARLQEEKKVRFNNQAFQKINSDILARFER